MSEQRISDQHPFTHAIDIYLFSNGQQYTPPRKYHLGAEDLDLWKSTLGFLARTQYGALHSNIELYTIDGKKVFGPLGLSHGASYVAVEPPDKFISAGYEKYLIRASRSQEKRQSRRLDSIAEPDALGRDSDIRDESLLQTIVSSTVDHHSSVLVKPEVPKMVAEKLRLLQISSVRIEKRRTSIPRPTIVKKSTPITTPPNPFVRPFLRNRESIKGTNFKVPKPETDKIPASSSGNTLNKSPARGKFFKPLARPRESIPREVSLARVKEEHHELNKTCSGIKISDRDKRDRNLSAMNLNDKGIVKASNLNNNDDTPSLDSNTQDHPIKIIIETVLDDAVRKNTDGYRDININSIRFVTSNKNDSDDIVITDASKPGCLFAPNNFAKEQFEIVNISNKPEGCSQKYPENDLKANSQEAIKMIKISESPKHSILIMTDKVPDKRRESKYITPHPTKEYMNVITEDNLNFIHSDEKLQPHGLASTAPDKPGDDQYVTVLKKGDVVNLKLNIEIKNRSSCCDKHKENSASNILYTEKGSQINMTSHILMQNNSLLSLINNELKCNSMSDKHPVIIVQCGDCKYCKNRNAVFTDKKPNKNYLILMPVDKFEENFNRCSCNKSLPEACNPSMCNPTKSSFSCMSLERVTKVNQCESGACKAAETVTTIKTDENIVFESKESESGLKRKVAIYDECSPATQDSSKVLHEINVTSELITCQDYCHSGFKETQCNIQITLVDNFTQTDWCDVLLEARLLQDGHYSFRLPTLEILKFYNLA